MTTYCRRIKIEKKRPICRFLYACKYFATHKKYKNCLLVDKIAISEVILYNKYIVTIALAQLAQG